MSLSWNSVLLCNAWLNEEPQRQRDRVPVAKSKICSHSWQLLTGANCYSLTQYGNIHTPNYNNSEEFLLHAYKSFIIQQCHP